MCRRPSARMTRRSCIDTCKSIIKEQTSSYTETRCLVWQEVFCMEEKSGNRPHACFLQNRAAANLTGVREVVSFDENQVVMDTDLGLLTLKGKELHVSRLSVEKGEVDVTGTVDSMTYSSNEAYRKSGQSFLVRLFK